MSLFLLPFREYTGIKVIFAVVSYAVVDTGTAYSAYIITVITIHPSVFIVTHQSYPTKQYCPINNGS
jgi:hypothetical protein